MFGQSASIQCVKDVCHIRAPLSATAEKSLPLILFYMNIMKVEAAGVIDEGNYCIGFVTSEDLIAHNHEESLKDIMRQPSMSVYRDDPIEQALIMMKNHKINWLPVIDYDTKQFFGLICRKDIESLSLNVIPFIQGKAPYPGTSG